MNNKAKTITWQYHTDDNQKRWSGGGAHNYIYKIQLLQNPMNQGSAPPLVYELHGGKKTYLAAN
jgi:hypothetical protein